jgi:hypothetical protein
MHPERSRRKTVGLAGLALTLAATLAALPADWAAQNRREAWREAAAFVEAHAGPNDAVVIQADYVHLAFERYFRGPQSVYFPFTDRLTDPAQVDAPLDGLSGYDAVWLVQSHHQDLDSGNWVAGWFGARFPLITEAYPAGIAIHGFVQRYRTPELPGEPAPSLPGEPAPSLPRGREDAVIGRQGDAAASPCLRIPASPCLGTPTLLKCVFEPAVLRARDDLLHPPSGWVHLTTYWTTTAPPAADLFPTVRLVDAAGQVWGDKLDRPGDAIHIWPTSRWLPGEVVRVDYDVNLNPATPPGDYRLVIGVAGGAGDVVCGEVRVAR